jgi:hypothetical protein
MDQFHCFKVEGDRQVCMPPVRTGKTKGITDVRLLMPLYTCAVIDFNMCTKTYYVPAKPPSTPSPPTFPPNMPPPSAPPLSPGEVSLVCVDTLPLATCTKKASKNKCSKKRISKKCPKTCGLQCTTR